MTTAALDKPKYRGVLHQFACFVAIALSAVLISWAPTRRGSAAAGIYSASLVTMFGISAIYHRRTWSVQVRPWLRRLDHAAIFVLIAGSYTPFCFLVPGEIARRQLAILWGGALFGTIVATFWASKPKFVNVVMFASLGWVVVFFIPSLRGLVDFREVAFLTAGGIVYTIGGLIYALKRPNPAPRLFGYHELFHAFTLVGAALHLAAVIEVVRRIK